MKFYSSPHYLSHQVFNVSTALIQVSTSSSVLVFAWRRTDLYGEVLQWYVWHERIGRVKTPHLAYPVTLIKDSIQDK